MGSGPGAACSINLNTTLTPEQRALYQNTDTIRSLLRDARTIAIVGLSADTQKASYFVGSYLQYEGFTVIPVNPRPVEILGRRAYPDLLSIPEKIDIVDIFRPSSEVSGIVDQAIAIKAGAVWMQLRISDFAAAQRARAAGLSVVIDKCIKMEHGRFGGSLHWAGMNTEIISARKPRPAAR